MAHSSCYGLAYSTTSITWLQGRRRCDSWRSRAILLVRTHSAKTPLLSYINGAEQCYALVTWLIEQFPLFHPRRYQLIYAVGCPAQLPALNERVAVIQALLRAFNRTALASSPEASLSPPSTTAAPEGQLSATAGAAEDTSNPPGSSDSSSSGGSSSHRGRSDQLLGTDTAVFSPPSGGGGGTAQPAGGWRGLRLLPGTALESELPNLLRCVVEELLARPPHRLAWLQAHPRRVRAMLYMLLALSARQVHGRSCLRKRPVATKRRAKPSGVSPGSKTGGYNPPGKTATCSAAVQLPPVYDTLQTINHNAGGAHRARPGRV